MNKFLYAFAVLFFTILSNAQAQEKGKISGKVTDKKTGEELIGVAIQIEGTSFGTVTDFEGKFTLSAAPGAYNLVFQYVSYNKKIVGGVVVIAKEVANINVAMEQASQELSEVVIKAEAKRENVSGLLIQQKNAASVSDGISAEVVKKTPDRSTADVIKRVSGATIQDNKFAIIRGMSDRYNAGFINGAPLPSSETDKKAFSFDMFPANILENIVILKTGRPDLTGEFGGGIIQINTINIPEKNSFSISIGAGDNFQTTFQDFKTTQQGGKTDWLGFDDGSRAMPQGFQSVAHTNDVREKNTISIENAKLFNYKWGFKNTQALPNLNLQATLSNVGLKGKFGSVVAISYNNFNSRTFTDKYSYNIQGPQFNVIKLTDYEDTTYSNVILGSALWNLSYKITPNHQIAFKNIFSINTEDKVLTRRGVADMSAEPYLWNTSNARWFTQNNIYSGQLIGNHYFEKAKIKFNWNAGYSDIFRKVPNLSRMDRSKRTSSVDDSVPYKANINQRYVVAPSDAGSMLFLETVENIKSMKYDVSRMFNLGKTKHELQIGGNHIIRERNFVARLFGYNSVTQGTSVSRNDSILFLDDEHIFAPQNVGVLNLTGRYKGGLMVVESTTPQDNYQAKSFTNAGYAMLDSRFLNSRLRFIYGARVEAYQQILEANLYGKPTVKDTTVIDILPSVNVVYSLNEKINIRAAYYRTVARPEFRELAPFQFQDFTTALIMSGNDLLQRSLINNYDLRLEWYPGAGQVVSVSGFYKKIDNAIEQVLDVGTTANFAVTFANAASAYNVGAELEYRFKLSSIFFTGETVKLLNNTTLFSNFTYIQSRVDNTNSNGGEVRPLQGQSPYIINAGIQYLDNKSGWGAAVSYNVVGRRIAIVGATTNPNIWEAPRHVLDFQVSKNYKNWDIKINLRDALAQNLTWYQDLDNNGKLTKGSLDVAKKELFHDYNYDNIFLNTRYSATLSFSIAYKFF